MITQNQVSIQWTMTINRNLYNIPTKKVRAQFKYRNNKNHKKMRGKTKLSQIIYLVRVKIRKLNGLTKEDLKNYYLQATTKNSQLFWMRKLIAMPQQDKVIQHHIRNLKSLSEVTQSEIIQKILISMKKDFKMLRNRQGLTVFCKVKVWQHLLKRMKIQMIKIKRNLRYYFKMDLWKRKSGLLEK